MLKDKKKNTEQHTATENPASQPFENSLNKAFETPALFVTHGSGSSVRQ